MFGCEKDTTEICFGVFRKSKFTRVLNFEFNI